MKKLNSNFLENEAFNKADYNYKQNELSPGIIHIGVGNFHRSHQAYYLDALFNQRKDFDFGIVGAGLRDSCSAMRKDLLSQDYLTTLVARDPNTTDVRILQSMIDFVDNNNLLLIDELSSKDIKIVSLTITEGGYYIDSYGEFNISHADIQKDINNPEDPHTVFGVIISALKNRKEKNIPPFTLMCCDNIAHNGNVLKNVICKMAEEIDSSLAKYIIKNVTFPNSMVDRITPMASKSDNNFILENYGYEDLRPVFCEPFTQWILEDNFCNTRPSLEDVGVMFVEDIQPYELMKIRLLNGSHACMSSLSALLNIEYVHEGLEDDLVKPFLDNIMKHEVIPVLRDIVDMDLDKYYQSVLTRFSNPYIADTITRIAMDNSNKQPKFVIDSIKDGIKNGTNINGLTLACALWCRYSIGTDEENRVLDINDPRKELLIETALKAKDKPIVFLQMKDIYGDLAQNDEFVKIFSTYLNSIWENGVKATVKNFNEEYKNSKG